MPIRPSQGWGRAGARAALLFIVWLTGCGRDEITPEDRLRAEAMVRYGIYLAEEGNLDSAQMVLEEAVAYDSTNAQALYRLGMVYEYLMRPETAEETYRRALTHDSLLGPAHLNLGQLYARAERYDEALRHFQAVLRADTTGGLRALTYYCIGMTHGIRGRAGEAAAAYADAAGIDTLFGRAYVGEGQELVRLGRYEEAVPVLLRAIEVDSSLSEAYSHLATAYRMLNRMDKAAAAEEAHQRARGSRRMR